jgi:hypothetical protein
MIKISEVLKTIGLPTVKMSYSGDATSYITYFIYNEYGEAFAENKEIATTYSVQVDIYTDGDFTNLYNQVLSLMTEAGFYRTYATEINETDIRLKHKLVRFQYTEEHL